MCLAKSGPFVPWRFHELATSQPVETSVAHVRALDVCRRHYHGACDDEAVSHSGGFPGHVTQTEMRAALKSPGNPKKVPGAFLLAFPGPVIFDRSRAARPSFRGLPFRPSWEVAARAAPGIRFNAGLMSGH